MKENETKVEQEEAALTDEQMEDVAGGRYPIKKPMRTGGKDEDRDN